MCGIVFSVTTAAVRLRFALHFNVKHLFAYLGGKRCAIGVAIASHLRRIRTNIGIPTTALHVSVVVGRPTSATLLVAVARVGVLVTPLLGIEVSDVTGKHARIVASLVPVSAIH